MAFMNDMHGGKKDFTNNDTFPFSPCSKPRTCRSW